MIKCNSCLEEKEEIHFYKDNRNSKKNVRKPCKSCFNIASQAKKFNISKEWIHKQKQRQNNCCAICGVTEIKNKRLFCIDHNHRTGKIRGLLCTKCNFAIGFFGDDIPILESAINYLNKSQTS